MVDSKYVHERLREFWPTSAQLTLAGADEIANCFSRLELGTNAFDEALQRYRAEAKKGEFLPTLRALRPFLPQTAASLRVRPDNEKKVVIWPASKYHSPRKAEADRLWQSAKYIEFCDVLLSEPGLTEKERGDAQALMNWAQWYRSPQNKMKSKSMKIGPHSAVRRVFDNMTIIPERESP